MEIREESSQFEWINETTRQILVGFGESSALPAVHLHHTELRGCAYESVWEAVDGEDSVIGFGSRLLSLLLGLSKARQDLSLCADIVCISGGGGSSGRLIILPQGARVT
jgi:hypothetical protein